MTNGQRLIEAQRAAVQWLKANRPRAKAKIRAAEAKLAELVAYFPAKKPVRNSQRIHKIQAALVPDNAMQGPNNALPRPSTAKGQIQDPELWVISSIRRPDQVADVVGKHANGMPSAGALCPGTVAELMAEGRL